MQQTRHVPSPDTRRSRSLEWRLERLEDRALPTVLDLTLAGSSGIIHGGLFSQFTQPSGGSGSIESFVRISANRNVTQGYNTDARPVQFDESMNSSFTHAIRLGAIPMVIAPSGGRYYQFLLDANQNSSGSDRLLSVDELRFYVTDTSTPNPAKLSNYQAATRTLTDTGGRRYAPVFDLDDGGDSWIKLDANLSSGSGAGDMIALIPVSRLGTDLNQYVYVYSKFGVNHRNTSGYEEWAAGIQSVGSVAGSTFTDTNGDGQKQEGEPALPGVTVYLDSNGNDILDGDEASTQSAIDGSFSFIDMLPGSYAVRAVAPAGAVESARIGADVVLEAGEQVTGVGFGFFAFASISGTKYQDRAGDGQTDDDPILNEQNPRFRPFTMHLYRDGTHFATTTTGSGGNYEFQGLGPGTYTVIEEEPWGWFQTSGPGSLTPTSGQAAMGFDFANFLLAERHLDDDSHLIIYTPAIGGSAVTVTESTVTDYQISVTSPFTGSLEALGVAHIEVHGAAGATVDARTVATAPVTLHDEQGDNTYVLGSSGATVFLDSGSTDSISVTGGRNRLNFSNTTFGVTFDAGINDGTPQMLEDSGEHVLVLTGQFQEVVGTGFGDVLIADEPTFDADTGDVGEGTTIDSGLGADLVIGTLATHATLGGSNSQYTQSLSTTALDTLRQALAFGASPTVLGAFGATVATAGGFSSVIASVMTTVDLGGAQNLFSQTIDAETAALLSEVTAEFGASPAILGGFGNTVVASGGFNVIESGLLTTATLTGGNNAFVQLLDDGARTVLIDAVGQFGATATTLGGFGAALATLGGFGNTVVASGGFSQVSATLLSSVEVLDSSTRVVQGIDAASADVLKSAIATIAAQFGSTLASQGGFGAALNVLGAFGNTVLASGGFGQIATSILSNVQMDGEQGVYVQSLDSQSAEVLESALSSFGSTLASQGGFGSAVAVAGGFGNTVVASGGYNTLVSSLLTSVSASGSNTTFVQSLDAASADILTHTIASFGSTIPATGGFGAVLNTLGGFGNTVAIDGGFGQVGTSLLSSVTISGDHATYVQNLDSNSTSVLDQLIAGFGSTPDSQGGFGNTVLATGGFGNTVAIGGGFGNTVAIEGGFSVVAASLLTDVSITGQNALYLQQVAPSSASVLDAAVTSFGAAVAVAGGFGNTVFAPGGFGAVLNTLGGFGNTVAIEGGFSQVLTSILSNVSVQSEALVPEQRGHNLYVQALDAGSVDVLSAVITSFGATLSSPGGFGASPTTLGGFGNTVTIDGGFNAIYSSLLTSSTALGGYNRYEQSIDANALAVLETALATLAGFGTSPATLGGFGNTVVASGGFNMAIGSLLAAIRLEGGFDSFEQTLPQQIVNVAAAALGAAEPLGGAALADTAAGIGLEVVLSDTDGVLIGGLLGSFTATAGGARMVIEDSSLLGASSISSVLLDYGGRFAAGAAPNAFYLVGSRFGDTTIDVPSTNSDTLDLSGIHAVGLTLDLSLSGGQDVLPSDLRLSLLSPGAFARVVGNGNRATIKAGTRALQAQGAALLDDRAVSEPDTQAATQLVYLDFTTFSEAGEYSYAGMEGEILERMAALYSDFNVEFTLEEPLESVPFATIFFNKRPVIGGVPEPGGLSDEIDFRNLNHLTTAAVDANGLLGGPGQPADTTDNVAALSATIAAHELGHTLGLRHLDAFSPIDFGISNPPGSSGFRPAYPGPQAAWETNESLIASPASVGSSLTDAIFHAALGEREAVKLAFNERGSVVQEQTGHHQVFSEAQPLSLAGLRVPNPKPRGFNAGKEFSVAAVAVEGASLEKRIDGTLESDFYAFDGRAGDLINMQTLSWSLTRISESADPGITPIDTELLVYDSSGVLVAYHSGQALNDDDFEAADAVIIDLSLPADGVYTIEVRPFDKTASAERGDYELFLYRFQAGNTTPQGGSGDRFVVGTGEATFVGRGGKDTVVDAGASTYSLIDGHLTGISSATLIDIAHAELTGAAGGTTFDVSGWTGVASLTGVGGTNAVVLDLGARPGDFTLSGDTLSVSTGGTFHLFNIQNIILKASASGSRFDVGGADRSVTIIGRGGIDTVLASRDADLFILADDQLSLSTGGVFALTGIESAELIGGITGTTFDLRDWTGSVLVNSRGGPNPARDPRGLDVQTVEGSIGPHATASLVELGPSVALAYTAAIDWGDSSSSNGSIATSGSTVTFSGSHAYEHGMYTITTTIDQGAAYSIIVDSFATVIDAPLMIIDTAESVPQGIDLSDTMIVTFVDANPSGQVDDFTVTIDWGDGSTPSLGIVRQPEVEGTPFTVGGAHTFATSGARTLVVTIVGDGGATASATFTVMVEPSIIVLHPSAADSMRLSGTVSITVGGYIVVNSSSSTALSAKGNAHATAGRVRVVGGVSVTNGAVVDPAPETGVAPVPDPLGALAVPAGLVNRGSIDLKLGNLTINPGVYTQIRVSGNGTRLTMNPGVYVLKEGGLTMSNGASLIGDDVTLYNAGSNYPNPGGSFGAISLGSSGAIDLSAPTAGTYAGILIFQARDNTRALSLNASSVVGLSGTIYAPAALMDITGSSVLRTPTIVGQLSMTGSGTIPLRVVSTHEEAGHAAGQLLGDDLLVFIDLGARPFRPTEAARIREAVDGLSRLLQPFQVVVATVFERELATLIIRSQTSTTLGGHDEGILALYSTGAGVGVDSIEIVDGWNWYTGANPARIGPDQFDFQTVVLHELGHALGLGHSDRPGSAMSDSLQMGLVRRNLTVADLAIPGVVEEDSDLSLASTSAPALGRVSSMLAIERSVDHATGYAVQVAVPSTTLIESPVSTRTGRLRTKTFARATHEGPRRQIAGSGEALARVAAPSASLDVHLARTTLARGAGDCNDPAIEPETSSSRSRRALVAEPQSRPDARGIETDVVGVTPGVHEDCRATDGQVRRIGRSSVTASDQAAALSLATMLPSLAQSLRRWRSRGIGLGLPTGRARLVHHRRRIEDSNPTAS